MMACAAPWHLVEIVQCVLYAFGGVVFVPCLIRRWWRARG